ncbi:hypothetical protein E2C01_071047 [Portunus trituberculatus]|uniref:Nuclease HARBI1 n=1 Tax=Portunus trituberculatus TaxID=210409 RepID=A0A5B7HVX5_PORTR|nr:hypothetical protein [Portunus trituberculatus]
MAEFRAILRGVGHLGELELMEEFPRHRCFQVRKDPFLEDTEGKFVQRFRLSKEATLALLTRIEHLLPASANSRGCRIPPKLQLLVTLRYYATGDFQLTMGDCCDMSQLII